jgi:RND family efflux transporter MFP subunit
MTYRGDISKITDGLRSVIPAVAVVLALGGCGGQQGDSAKKAEVSAPVVKGLLLETVSTAALPESVELIGTVRSRNSAVVSTRVPGTVSILKVREGDRVRKGQLLAQLDAQENQAHAAAAVSGADESQRGLEEAQSRKKLADTTFERYQKLFKEQAVTRQEFDVKQAERELASQGVARAEARLNQSREGSRAAATMAGYTRIVAPISGIISSKQVDPGATVFPGQPLMTIEDEGNYQLELAVPESMSGKVKPGTAVQVTLDSGVTTLNLKIAEIVPVADPNSRTFSAKVNLSQKGLASGTFGRAAIALGTSTNAIRVRKTALVERGALTFVWVVDKNSIIRMRLVKAGKNIGDMVEILSGLSDGERVAVNGVEKISEGSKVE